MVKYEKELVYKMFYKFRGGQKVRIFKFFMLITVLSVSLNNVSADEGDFESLHKKYPNAVDTLTEDSEKEAGELEQKVSEDIKNNPFKVKYAVPLDDSVSTTNEGDVSRVVTVEEQEMRENNPIEGEYTTVISAEEQNMVENSTVQFGFVEQENGTGFFFKKVK